MNTKALMIISAIFLAVNGFGFTFFPNEIAGLLGLYVYSDNYIFILILQILGALYLGFSILNWTAKASLIGGIYNKPILLGNLLHFFTASMTLLKLTQGFQDNQLIFSYTIIYSLFTLSFGYVFFTNPSLK